jgi:hypothetical protein
MASKSSITTVTELSSQSSRPALWMRLLEGFYAACWILAGLLMIATGSLVLASALARLFG